jgi:benzylsuccinate CoA-transferase BbsF subunit
MPVQSSEDRVEYDPQLRARGLYTEMDHPLLGRRKFQGPPFTFSKSPAVMHRPGPLLGQHTREVCERLLGLGLEDIREGYADGTFWPPEMPLYPYIQEGLKCK